MSDPAQSAGPPTSWRLVNLVLLLLALLLVAASIALFTAGASATPGESEVASEQDGRVLIN